jgi:hypothetical protein
METCTSVATKQVARDEELRGECAKAFAQDEKAKRLTLKVLPC